MKKLMIVLFAMFLVVACDPKSPSDDAQADADKTADTTATKAEMDAGDAGDKTADVSEKSEDAAKAD